MTEKNIGIQLDCGHRRWFKPPLPDLGETLWCPECQTYCDVGPGLAKTQKVWYPEDDMEVEPILNKRGWYRGYCTHTKNNKRCDTIIEKRGFYQVKEIMHKHYMREHTRFGATQGQEQLAFDVDIIPEKGSQYTKRKDPPF